MAKKKAVPRYVEPQEENQEIPEEPDTDEETEVNEPEVEGRRISKAAAVREALAQGKDGPEEGTDYIRRVYGIEVTRQMFSSYKTQAKAKQSAQPEPKSKPGRKPNQAPSQALEGYLAPSPVQRNGESDLIESLETLKPLIAQYGADKVKRLSICWGERNHAGRPMGRRSRPHFRLGGGRSVYP